MTASSSRLGCGGATVDPAHAGQRAEHPLGAGAYGGLVGVDGGQQIDDVLVVLRPASRASSRWAGVRSGCPSVTARLLAALMASRLLLVSSASTCPCSSSVSAPVPTPVTDSVSVHKVESIPLKAVAGGTGRLDSRHGLLRPRIRVTPDPSYLSFWRERHLCTLTTPRPDGTPHVVPVGVTYDPAARLARVITNRTSAKVRAHPGGRRGRGARWRCARWQGAVGDAGGAGRGPHGAGTGRGGGAAIRRAL